MSSAIVAAYTLSTDAATPSRTSEVLELLAVSVASPAQATTKAMIEKAQARSAVPITRATGPSRAPRRWCRP